jgi:hypothetical protein
VKIEQYKKDLDRLIEKGQSLYAAAIFANISPEQKKKAGVTDESLKILPDVRKEYQSWYSEALTAVKQLLPDRLEDFVNYYKPQKARKTIDASTYTISDYLHGLESSFGARKVVGVDAAIPLFQQQLEILKSLRTRFDSSLFDIRTIVQADLFDNELDAAAELNKKGFIRGAGAIAGVVLEGHMATVCEQHKIAVPINSSIATLNDLLKKNDVIDTPTWRNIQHLGDLRNLCDHKKAQDPTKEQMLDLIQGVRKAIKTIF